MKFTDSVREIKGVGEKTSKLMEKLGIYTVKDLLHAFPRDYDEFETATTISRLQEGERAVIAGYIVSTQPLKKVRNLTILNAVVRDATGAVNLTFFNQPYLAGKLKPGYTYFFRGTPQAKGEALVMEQPTIYTAEEYQQLQGSIRPIYNLTKGLTNRTMTNAVERVLAEVELPEEFFPEYFQEDCTICDRASAYRGIHFPKNLKEASACRDRFAFEELFAFTYTVQREKGVIRRTPNAYISKATRMVTEFMVFMPFMMTAAQLRVWGEIKADMGSRYAMNRLVQGDVGCGKTVVAIMALLQNVENGYQTALMAPTEVLARQHMETIEEMTRDRGLSFRPVLLVGSMTAKQKSEARERIKSGDANLVIGTHAIIQEKVEFQNLALVVTDEQHRFGVKQREALAGKGKNPPHVLVMSATPIPRTLAIILYGDMHMSVIDEMPRNRLPRKNCVVGTEYRPKAYKFIAERVAQGEQAYVICPMVEPSEEGDNGLENVIDYAEKLKRELPESVRIQYLHGRMRPKDKTAIMESFARGEIDVLVSTTVIEVGINVPNATVMMVENSERFGLAALHQLRGRVGRGDRQGYCIFVTGKKDERTRKRLDILSSTNDGFAIANADLEHRGPGDLFGVRQSGDFGFRVADIYRDAHLLLDCTIMVDYIMNEDPDLEEKRHHRLRRYLELEADHILDFRSI